MLSWFNSVADFLGPNAPVAQFIAYTCLTVTSVIVASVSLRFSFRQNFGWQPILLVASHGLQGGSHTGEKMVFEITLLFEVWNRRTYPIVIQTARVFFEQKGLLDSFAKKKSGNDDWHIDTQGKCWYGKRAVVKNGEHLSFNLIAPMVRGYSIDAIDGNIHIHIDYFDPRRNKNKKLYIKHRFSFKSSSSFKRPIGKLIRKKFGAQHW